MSRTQTSSVGDGEDQEDFPGELSLHSDPLTPEAMPCTPANAVEVHRDSQPGEENPLLECMKHKNILRICNLNDIFI